MKCSTAPRASPVRGGAGIQAPISLALRPGLLTTISRKALVEMQVVQCGKGTRIDIGRRVLEPLGRLRNFCTIARNSTTSLGLRDEKKEIMVLGQPPSQEWWMGWVLLLISKGRQKGDRETQEEVIKVPQACDGSFVESIPESIPRPHWAPFLDGIWKTDPPSSLPRVQ